MSKDAPSKAKPAADALMIAGSAGFVGKALLRRLAEKNRPLISLYNSHLPEPMAHITPVFADMLRPDHLGSALRSARTVVHLAWSQSFQTRWDDAFWTQEGPKQDSRNIQMVKNLVHAMEDAGTQRIIFLSALGASRKAESWFLQEKYFAEAVILNSKIPEKIILRSSLIFADLSAHDRLVSTIARLMRFPWFYPVPRCSGKLAPIHVQDLCEMIIRLIDIDMQGVEGAHLFEVDGGESIAIDEMFRYVSQGLGKGAHFALKGLLGNALMPIMEKLQKRKQENLPQLRDLLTIGYRRTEDSDLASPLRESLPVQTRRFQESMTMARGETLKN